MSICGAQCAVKETPHEAYAKRLKCRRWYCLDCQPGRRKRLMAEILSGRPKTFLTLTHRVDDTISNEEKLTRLNRAWRILRKRFLRAKGLKRLAYFTVVEGTRSDTPHLHILLRKVWIDQAWISSVMDELVASPIVDIRRIDNPGRAAGYVAKYVGKAPTQFGTHKRYYQAQDWRVEPKPEKLDPIWPHMKWERHTFSMSKWHRSQQELGYAVRWITDDLLHSRGPP